MTGTGVHRQYLFTADDYRVAVVDELAGEETWSIRGLHDKVLRQSAKTEDGWIWDGDWIYWDGLLTASTRYAEMRFYLLDHLGSPRIVADPIGQSVTEYRSFPFGQLASPLPENDTERNFRFTGHERDTHCTGCSPERQDDLDYMLARYYSPWVGRFLSVDPLGGNQNDPQSWNLYTYVTGNPLKYIDPTGMAKVCTGEGNSESCVFVDGNGDGDTSDEDLTEDQVRMLSEAYAEFIAANDGADLGEEGTRVRGGDEADRSLIRAASQFVGANLEHGWQNTEIRLVDLGKGNLGQMHWKRSRWTGPDGLFQLLINPAEGDHLSNPSSIARTLIHEYNHREHMSVRGNTRAHRDIDDRAKAAIKAWGLDGLGCPAAGSGKYFGFGPPFFSGCS